MEYIRCIANECNNPHGEDDALCFDCREKHDEVFDADGFLKTQRGK